jgi:putative glutamine amidotransferase
MEIAVRPVALKRYSQSLTAAKKSEGSVPQESFVSSDEVSIEDRAARLHRTWASRMKTSQCDVGILCERGWTPESDDDPVLQIADAVMDAGGKPRLLFIGEPVSEQMKGLDALAIPGGRDVHPKYYGQQMGPGMSASQPDPDFDAFEIEIIQTAFDSGMPMLGHCRGEQIMNVAAGGTLVQDIPTEFKSPEGWGSKYGTRIDHRPPANNTNANRENPVHLLVVAENARLHDIVGDSLEFVNSVHHQAIAQVAPILTAVAWSPDGLVEGVERKGKPWQSAYQFHPESLRHTDGAFQKLYANLVKDGVRFRAGELS